MVFWSGIVTVNCSACLSTPALRGPSSSLGGPVGCCFWLFSSVAVWSSGYLFLLFAYQRRGFGGLPPCAVGRSAPLLLWFGCLG